jgi:hypothetical protein
MSERYGPPRRVVQAYRRLGERASVDNPYPTIVSASRAIEERGNMERRYPPSDFQPAEAVQRIDKLGPAKTIDPNFLRDMSIIKNPPKVPLEGSETFYSMDPYGGLTQHRPKSERDYLNRYGEWVTETNMGPLDLSDAAAAVHTHTIRDHQTVPGMQDWEIPVEQHLPLYGVTKTGKWRVNPPDAEGRITVDLIDGEWGVSDQAVKDAIEQLNRRERLRPSRRR